MTTMMGIGVYRLLAALAVGSLLAAAAADDFKVSAMLRCFDAQTLYLFSSAGVHQFNTDLECVTTPSEYIAWPNARQAVRAVDVLNGTGALVIDYVPDSPDRSVQLIMLQAGVTLAAPPLNYARNAPSVSRIKLVTHDLILVCGCAFGQKHCHNTCETLMVQPTADLDYDKDDGDKDPALPATSLSELSPLSKAWQLHELALPCDRTAAIVLVGNAAAINIYSVGGDCAESRRQVLRYDWNTKQWYHGKAASKYLWTGGHTAVEWDDVLYVCGGTSDGGRRCARYSLARNEWLPMASMNVQRFMLTLVVHRGRLYALGGANPVCRRRDAGDDRLSAADAVEVCYANHSAIHSTVEVYDRAADAWTVLHSVQLPEPMLSPGVIEARDVDARPPCLRTSRDRRPQDSVITIGQSQMNVMIVSSLFMCFLFFALLVAFNQ